MLTVLIGVLAGIVFGAIIGYREWHDAWDGFMGALMGLLVGGLLSCLIAAGIGAAMPKKLVVVERDHLVSLNDADGLHGSFSMIFFIASGEVNSTRYIYYVQSTPEGYQFHSVEEDNSHVFVVQEARTDGELDLVDHEFVNPSDYLWGLPLGGQDQVFHVPSGTVTTCFTLNQSAAAAGITGNTGCPAGK